VTRQPSGWQHLEPPTDPTSRVDEPLPSQPFPSSSPRAAQRPGMFPLLPRYSARRNRVPALLVLLVRSPRRSISIFLTTFSE
jgi:hypothetical protein